MNTKQLTAFAESMMHETSTQIGEWVTVSRIALDEMSRETLLVIERIEAAERERDELRASQEHEDNCLIDGLASRDEWRLRAITAEAELARLKAGSEPVYQFIANRPDIDGYIEWVDCNKDYYSKETVDSRRVLYTAAQPQSVVELPDTSGERYAWSDGVYNLMCDIKVAINAAGVKWVQK